MHATHCISGLPPFVSLRGIVMQANVLSRPRNASERNKLCAPHLLSAGIAVGIHGEGANRLDEKKRAFKYLHTLAAQASA